MAQTSSRSISKSQKLLEAAPRFANPGRLVSGRSNARRPPLLRRKYHLRTTHGIHTCTTPSHQGPARICPNAARASQPVPAAAPKKNIPVQAYMGSSGCSSSYRCRSCEGDCDSDSDCAAGLKCFQRGSTDTVPSCAGDSSRYYSSEDYCYDPKSADRGLCTSKSVSFGKVTRQICTNTPTVCAVIMKGQIEIKTCRQYCAVYGMQCTGQYGKYTYNDDDDQFRYGGYGGENDGTQCQKGKAGSCDDAGGTQTCECAEVDQRTRESQLRPVATKTESQPWLTVDLGKVVSVGKIRVTAYSHDGDYDAGKEDYIGLEGARISTSAGTGWNATANWRGFFKGNKRVHEFYVCDKAGPTVATTSTTTTTQPVTTTTTTAQCPAGKFLIGQSTGAEQCAACSNGQYRSELSHRFTTCQTQTVCRIGTSYTGGSTTAAAKCVACKPGTYQNNDNHQLGTCKPQTMCSAGEYLAGASTSSAGTCNSCNTGQFQDSPTSHREAKCKEQNQCTPGQYLRCGIHHSPRCVHRLRRRSIPRCPQWPPLTAMQGTEHVHRRGPVPIWCVKHIAWHLQQLQ